MRIGKTGYTVAGLLSLHALLLAYGAARHSPTLNEPGHLAAGISVWKYGRFDVYNVNPPLVRTVAALPILASARTDLSSFYPGAGIRSEFPLGEDCVAANGERAMGLVAFARWACIPFCLLGGWICYRWATELGGRGQRIGDSNGRVAGLLALALWCFCPNILAHGALITPDAGATALAVAACYTFWRWLREPTWRGTLGSGLVLGLAELAKTTLVVFYPLWVVMWLVYRFNEPAGVRGRWWLRELAMLAARMAIAVYVINLGYAFEGSLTRLGDFKFVSNVLGAEGGAEKAPPQGGNRFKNSWLGSLPMPLPKNYVLGIDLQKHDFEDYHHPSYLRGEFREKGWWYYYLYALAIKVPLGTWVLFVMACTAGWWSKALTQTTPLTVHSPKGRGVKWRDEFVLLCPAVVIFVFVSSQTGFSEHMRYVLPCFPFVFIWIGRVAFVFENEWWGSSHLAPHDEMRDAAAQDAFRSCSTYEREAADAPLPKVRWWRRRTDFILRSKMTTFGRRAVTFVVAGALPLSIGSSLWVFPHGLSYFNEIAGGPTGGPEHLIHSNVDWGQDLLFLKDWLAEHRYVTGLGDPRPAQVTQGPVVGGHGAGVGSQGSVDSNNADPARLVAPARAINLIYFGYFDPKHAGIEYTVPEELLKRREGPVPLEEIPPGWYAVSVNFVRGYPWFVYKPDGTKAGLPLKALTAFQQLKPVAMAGYSIYIYHVEARDKSPESTAGKDKAEE